VGGWVGGCITHTHIHTHSLSISLSLSLSKTCASCCEQEAMGANTDIPINLL